MENNWQFNFDKSASFTMRERDMLAPWEFIYQNRDILVRVDQNGLNNCQAIPPKDIMLFKREWNEKYSKWLVWVQSSCLNDGKPVSCFGVPKTDILGEKPIEKNITFAPEAATYIYKYKNVTLTTQLTVPSSQTIAVLTTTIKNTSAMSQQFEATPCLLPYINQAVMAPWDKPEWYMQTSVNNSGEQLRFETKLLSPSGERSKRRYVSMQMDGGADSYEHSLERFCGDGDFNNPVSIVGDLEYKATESCEDMCGYPPVYAAKYKFTLPSGGERTLTQVLCMRQGKSQSVDLDSYFSTEDLTAHQCSVANFYDNLFSKQRITTGDRLFDYYVNNFLPLQMYWVASLDRGWPTGMRGVRDCSNDFIGMLPLSTEWSKKILLEVASCERSDGLFPRQISTEGKGGKHDLRKYVDGGVFFLEFLYEYLCFSGDIAVLCEQIPWLDSDRVDSLMEHAIKALDFYLDSENIGEHGLVKIYEGDWLDAVNRAGLKGRGESVTVTNQVIMSLDNMLKIFDKVKAINSSCYSSDYDKLGKRYIEAKKQFSNNLIKYAYNSEGYFSSVFTDGGEWLFSDKDPDGERRIYAVSNYYAIISGVADAEMSRSIMKNVESLKCDMGYRLFYPPLGKQPIENVGRIASGDQTIGLWENGTVYNHGSQGFLCRALSCVRDADKLFEVIKYMLPYTHDTKKTLSAPYAVVNCYQDIDCFKGRGGMPFLTGSVAMILRAVYNWMFGTKYELDGIRFVPCLKRQLSGSKMYFEFRSCVFEVEYIAADKDKIDFNGLEIFDSFISQEKFLKHNKIKIYFN